MIFCQLKQIALSCTELFVMAYAVPPAGAGTNKNGNNSNLLGSSNNPASNGNGHVSINIDNDQLKLDDMASSKGPLGVAQKDPNGAFGDMDDLKDECNYIRKVLLNFQTGMKQGNLDPDVMNLLKEFNHDVAFIASEFSGQRPPTGHNQAPVVNNNGSNPVGAGVLPRVPGASSVSNATSTGGNLNFSQPRGDGLMASSPHCNVGSLHTRTVDPLPNNMGHNESMSMLVNALSNLDMRPVPAPRIFDSESGQPFKNFLDLFENYCKRSFRGDDDPSHTSWGNELEKFLQGSLHEAYVALHIVGEPYEVLRQKLLDWVGSSRDKMAAEAKRKFTEAKRKPEEQMRLYAARLYKYYQVAYPNRVNSGKFNPLIEKYTNTVTGRMRDRILNTEAALGDGELTWDKVLSIASKYDARNYSVACESPTINECLNVQEVTAGWHGSYDARGDRMGTGPILSGANVHPLGQGNGQGNPSPPTRRCYRCDEVGHFIRDCTLKAPGRQCYVCGSPAHRAADCNRRFRSSPGRDGRVAFGGNTSPNGNNRTSLNM